MSFTKDEMLEILSKAKDMGLKAIKIDGVEASFEAQAVVRAPVEPQVMTAEDEKQLIEALKPVDMPTDEEILYWHSPYYDELQAQKELKAKSKEGMN